MLGSDNFLYASELYRLYHDAVGVRKVAVCIVLFKCILIQCTHIVDLGKYYVKHYIGKSEPGILLKLYFFESLISIKLSTCKKDPESEKQGFNSTLSVLSLELVKKY